MKSVLISIQPKWVEKIASGEKTIEVRKTRPKLETPFKCYIYATKSGDRIVLKNDKVFEISKAITGKVIGEFVCDKIYNLFPFAMGTGIELFDELVSPEMFCKESCLTEQEICDYIGEKDGYGWHISDLKIYDKPKELSEFYTFESNIKCEHQKNYYIYPFCEKTNKDKLCRDIKDCPRKRKQLTRPPQSWCYVESGVQCE